MQTPATFRDLLDVADDIPIELGALVLARDVYPRLDVEAQLARLDALAGPLVSRIATARSTTAQAGALGTYVYDELGFRGDEETYYDPRNSLLNDVLERRMGIPISLAIVLMAVGRRAGANVEGIGFPGHFLVRLGGIDGIYLDPFFHARILSPDALERLLRRAMGDAARLTPEHLVAHGTRAMLARMLTNLKALYESRREHARALVVCDRLVDLTASPELQRDRGLHAIALGATEVGAADFEAYLAARPTAPDGDRIRTLLANARTHERRAN